MTHIQCELCGFIGSLGAAFCPRCGGELRGARSRLRSPVTEPLRNAEPEVDGRLSGEFQFAPWIRPFTGIGAVLSPTLRLFKENVWSITKIVFLIFAPIEIFQSLRFGANPISWQAGLVLFLLGGFCNSLVAFPLIFALTRIMQTGIAPGLKEAYRWGLGRIGRTVLVALLAAILQAVGYLCLLVPGVLLTLSFEVIYPLAAHEDHGPFATLKRSFDLTKRHLGKIFLTRLVFSLLLIVAGIPARAALRTLAAYGINYWPFQAAVGIIVDILSQTSTILSLVIYLSITSTTPARPLVAETARTL